MARALNPNSPGDVPLFTTKERQVLDLLPTHLSIGAIGAALGMRRSTAKTHVAHVYRKLGVTNRSEAVEQARTAALVPPSGQR